MSEMAAPGPTWLDLYDYRRRVARIYREREAALRAGEDEQKTWERWRAGRDALFARHPQSALSLEERQRFSGLRYFPYNPALRLEATLEPETVEEEQTLEASGAHVMRFRRAGLARFTLEGTPLQLVVYWIDVYGGGLFLPFRDETCGRESYGGGRYLFDTVKGSDFVALETDAGDAAKAAREMGYNGGRILLDFNYAYNPSCAYDARWVCPLAPNENRLPVAIRAGELAFHQ
jgi:uncharacterized protein (DUF1684 family)